MHFITIALRPHLESQPFGRAFAESELELFVVVARVPEFLPGVDSLMDGQQLKLSLRELINDTLSLIRFDENTVDLGKCDSGGIPVARLRGQELVEATGQAKNVGEV